MLWGGGLSAEFLEDGDIKRLTGLCGGLAGMDRYVYMMSLILNFFSIYPPFVSGSFQNFSGTF